MKCCDNHDKKHPNQEKRRHTTGHMSHMWMMLLCCGAPLILLSLISLLGAGFPGIRSALIGIVPYACPVLMLIMMPMMLMHGKQDGGSRNENQNETGNEDK